jgi:hypothetical protein
MCSEGRDELREAGHFDISEGLLELNWFTGVIGERIELWLI